MIGEKRCIVMFKKILFLFNFEIIQYLKIALTDPDKPEPNLNLKFTRKQSYV